MGGKPQGPTFHIERSLIGLSQDISFVFIFVYLSKG